MVAENAYKTFTVGVTHFVSPSSPFWDWLNAGILSRRTARAASGACSGDAGLKGGKVRVGREVFLIVRFQRSVENGHKARVRGGCRGDGGHASP